MGETAAREQWFFASLSGGDLNTDSPFFLHMGIIVFQKLEYLLHLGRRIQLSSSQESFFGYLNPHTAT